MFGEAATSADIFGAGGRDLVRSVVDGYNGTVFAYGQTAAGKTHTMLGACACVCACAEAWGWGQQTP